MAFLIPSTVFMFLISIDKSVDILTGKFLFTAATSHDSIIASDPALTYHSDILCISLNNLSISDSLTGFRS